MSNSGTYIGNLGKDPEDIEFSGRQCVKLRIAEKAASKRAETRWFTAIVGGPDTEAAKRLKKGDTVAVVGELVLTKYKAKKPRYSGEMLQDDEMPFAKLLRIIKSPSFFGDGDVPADAGAPTADAPEGDTPPDLTGLD